MMNDGDFFVPLTLEYYNAYVKLIVIHNAFYYPQSQCAGCEARAYFMTA
jgi:hypothetical protein